MHYDRDGRFQLRYSAPATVGALVEQAVREAKDALFTQLRTNGSMSVHRASEDHHARGGYASSPRYGILNATCSGVGVIPNRR